jgi:positive regulator of sigma E activity
MQETGTVIRISENRAAVSIQRPTGKQCAGCHACKPMGEHRFVLWVDADDLAEGDRVTVEVPTPGPWRASLLVFGLPLVALVAGLVIGSRWTRLQEATGLGPEGAGLAAGVALAVLCFAGAVTEERRFAKRHRPRIIKIERLS